jgi:hypothetical protein
MYEQLAFDRELRTRLKEVRDEQPRPDRAHLSRLRRLALKRAQMRRLFRTTTALLTATTAILAGVVLPQALSPSDPVGRPVQIAQAGDDLVGADPWVAASKRRTSVEGDGWIPRPGVPNS